MFMILEVRNWLHAVHLATNLGTFHMEQNDAPLWMIALEVGRDRGSIRFYRM